MFELLGVCYTPPPPYSDVPAYFIILL
jgi:hypothetical protein